MGTLPQPRQLPAAQRRRIPATVHATLICAAAAALLAGAPSWGQPPEKPDAANAAEEALREEALDAANRLVRDFPDTVDPLGVMGDLYISLGNTAEAIKCWERCIELDPKRTDSYRCIAEAALRSGDFEKTVAVARKALQVDTASRDVNGLLGRALVRLGRPNEAVAALLQDVQVSPRASLSHLALGHAYQQLREFRKAKDSFLRALEIDPTYTEACYGVAVACDRLGQKDEAATYREKFRQMKADDWEKLPTAEQTATTVRSLVLLRQRVTVTHTRVGIVYYERGRLAEAEKHWLRAAQLDPKDTACRHELATLYQRTGRLDKALDICQQLLRILPDSVHYHVGHSVLLVRMDRLDAALTAVERALELDPRNASALRLRQQILSRKNR